MKRRRKSTGLLAFAIFGVFIIVSGFALKAADYIDSPFDDIAFTSQWANGGEQQFADTLGQRGEPLNLETPAASTPTGVVLTGLNTSDSQFQLPPVSAENDSSLGTDTGFNGRPDRENNIAWSDIGGVFYDLWFIGAMTAGFIVIQYLFKFSIKQIKSRLAAAPAK